MRRCDLDSPDCLAVVVDDLTKILEQVGAGDAASLNQLYDLVHAELRAMAGRKMASERPGHSLQPTALVNEAYLRLAGSEGMTWKNRRHFFAAASEAMRRTLVENARRKRQLKRGGGDGKQVELFESRIVAPVEDDKLLQVHDALEILAREDLMKAEIVKLRFFVGLKHQEIADAIGVNEKTVRRHWAVAKVRLFEIISGPSQSNGTRRS